MEKRTEAKGKVYTIPVRSIVANTNPRNPLGVELQRQGWTLFEGGPEKMPGIWHFATSEDATKRQFFTEVMQLYDPEFCSWAATFITQGQLQPVEVRDNGTKAGKEPTYTLVFGARRCLAILYNWCLTGKPKEPVVEARLAKGNNAGLLQRSIVENRRLQPSLIEEARAMQQSINLGMTTEEVAQEQGVTSQTVRNRLALLELPPDIQHKIHEGKLTATKALAEEKEPKADNGKPRMQKRKVIEEALGEYSEDNPVGKALRWVLGLRENLR